MKYNTHPTEKQKMCLILFAQAYPIHYIAEEQKVSISMIWERLQGLRINHPIPFTKALAIREVYKNDRDSIRNMKNFTDLGANDTENDDSGFRSPIERIASRTKRKF